MECLGLIYPMITLGGTTRDLGDRGHRSNLCHAAERGGLHPRWRSFDRGRGARPWCRGQPWSIEMQQRSTRQLVGNWVWFIKCLSPKKRITVFPKGSIQNPTSGWNEPFAVRIGICFRPGRTRWKNLHQMQWSDSPHGWKHLLGLGFDL